MAIKYDPFLGRNREEDFIIIENSYDFVDTTARDTYFGTKYAELTAGLLIKVGDTLSEWRGTTNPTSYDNTKWVNVSPVTAIKGADGAGTDFDHISENHIPAIGTNKIPYDSGLFLNADGDLVTTGSLRVGSNSLDFDQAQRISSGIENVIFKNIYGNVTYYPAWQVGGVDSTGRALARTWVGPKVVDRVEQAVKDVTLVNPAFPLDVDTISTGGIRIVDFQLELTEASADPISLLIKATTGEVVYRLSYPAKTAGVQRFALESFFDVKAGQSYNIELTGVSVLGDGPSSVPWHTMTVRPWEDKDIALVEETLHPYGGGYVSNTSVICSSSASAYKIDADITPHPLRGFEWDNTNKRFKYTGDTEVLSIHLAMVAQINAAAGAVVRVYKNGTYVPGLDRYVDFQTSSDNGFMDIVGLIELNTNDYIELFVQCGSDNRTLTITALQLVFR